MIVRTACIILSCLLVGNCKQLEQAQEALQSQQAGEPETEIQTISGVVRMDHEHETENESEYRYWLDTDTERFLLKFNVAIAFDTGAQVTLKGQRTENIFTVDEVVEQSDAATSVPADEDIPIVTLLVYFQGTEEPMPAATAQGKLFTNADSLKAFVEENSYGRTTIHGDIFGPYQLSLEPLTPQECKSKSDQFDLDMVREAVAKADDEVDFTQYRNLVLIHPEVPCLRIAGGTVGPFNRLETEDSDGPLLYASVRLGGDFNLVTVAHEFGHNLGNLHANALECGDDVTATPLPYLEPPPGCKSLEYGDGYDTMGVNLMHYNAFEKEQLGWLSQNQLIEVTGDQLVTLTPYAAQNDELKVVKIFKESGEGPGRDVYYYLEYRQPIGFDNSLPTRHPTYRGLLMHQGPNLYHGGKSQLLDLNPKTHISLLPEEHLIDRMTPDFVDAALGVDGTYTDELNQFTITVRNLTADGLTVDIQYKNK